MLIHIFFWKSVGIPLLRLYFHLLSGGEDGISFPGRGIYLRVWHTVVNSFITRSLHAESHCGPAGVSAVSGARTAAGESSGRSWSLHSKTLSGTLVTFGHCWYWYVGPCLLLEGSAEELKGNLCLRKWDFVTVALMVFSPTSRSEQSVFETYL